MVVSKKSPLTIQGSGRSLSGKENSWKTKTPLRCGAPGEQEGLRIGGISQASTPFSSPSRSLSNFFFFLLLFFLSFCLPVRSGSLTTLREGQGKAREKHPPPPPESKRQPPALPTEPGWGGHLLPGARPLFLSQTVLTTTGPGHLFSAEPMPQAWSVLRPWPLGRSDTSVFYFNEGTWPLGLSFLVSRSRGAQLAVGRQPRVLPRPYQALMPCKFPCAHAAPAAAP